MLEFCVPILSIEIVNEFFQLSHIKLQPYKYFTQKRNRQFDSQKKSIKIYIKLLDLFLLEIGRMTP